MAAPRANWSLQGTDELMKLVREKGTSDLQVIADELLKKDPTWRFSTDQVHNKIENQRKAGNLPSARGNPPKKRKIEGDEKGTPLILSPSSAFPFLKNKVLKLTCAP
jgi:hypothetical protein